MTQMSEATADDRPPQDQERVRASYDAVAATYTERVHDELRNKPLDRGLLNAFADQLVSEHGTGAFVCDMGCGPGHVGALLAARGLTVTGIDLSPSMIERARALHPAMTFEVGSMTALDAPDGRYQGIVAFYSIIHLSSDAEVRAALDEFHRVLGADGLLLVAVHLGAHGDEIEHADEMLGVNVDIDFRFFDADALAAAVTSAGFTIEARLVRLPYEGVEVQTTRAYLLARRTGPPNNG
jgi:ubiquinone/menaquinone biosynthesis C-methylase UbiE